MVLLRNESTSQKRCKATVAVFHDCLSPMCTYKDTIMLNVTPRFPNDVNNTYNQSIQRKTECHTAKCINRVKLLFIKNNFVNIQLHRSGKFSSFFNNFGTTAST